MDPDATQGNRQAWDAYAEEYQREAKLHHENDLWWGPSIPGESKLSILGDVRGKDILEVGAGAGQSGIHLAAQGARVTCSDLSAAQLEHGRALAAARGVEVAFLEASAEDLSALPPSAFDIVFSSYAYGFVPDVRTAFREAARVLRPGGLFVFSWSSPIHMSTEVMPDGRVAFDRSYFHRAPMSDEDAHGRVTSYHRTYGDWHRALTGADLVVRDILEPESDGSANAWPEVFSPAKLATIPVTTIWVATLPGPRREPFSMPPRRSARRGPCA